MTILVFSEAPRVEDERVWTRARASRRVLKIAIG